MGLSTADGRDRRVRFTGSGQWVAANGVDAPGRYRAGRDLLLRKPPRLVEGEKLAPLASEKPENTASRIVLALEDSVFAIQGLRDQERRIRARG